MTLLLTSVFGPWVPCRKTGQDIFDLCCRYEDEMQVTDFGVLDENFMKMKARAIELPELMERNEHRFTSAIFSSAETLKEIGDLDIPVRLGVTFIKQNKEKQRVSIGLKQLTPDPWNEAEEKSPIHARVNGKGLSLVEDGAFAEVEKGIEGLIRVSERS